jgi:hypothetical protein
MLMVAAGLSSLVFVPSSPSNDAPNGGNDLEGSGGANVVELLVVF